MKKLLKSKICGSLNSTRDPHVAENWLKSQTFWLKKKKKQRQKRKRVWEAQNAPTHTVTQVTRFIAGACKHARAVVSMVSNFGRRMISSRLTIRPTIVVYI